MKDNRYVFDPKIKPKPLRRDLGRIMNYVKQRIAWCPCGRGFTDDEWKKRNGKCDCCSRVHEI